MKTMLLVVLMLVGCGREQKPLPKDGRGFSPIVPIGGRR